MRMPGDDRFFNFSKKELNGIAVLGVLILLSIISPYVYEHFFPQPVPDLSRVSYQPLLPAGAAAESGGKAYPLTEKTPAKKASRLFYFDPNNLPAEKWMELGLTERQARGIKNYEAKGGRFRRREDLQKMYTVSARDYARLKDYIRIHDRNENRDAHFEPLFPEKKTAAVPVVVEINSADSAQLTEIRGIGPSFASRIIRYRDRLGGFREKEQLKEVFGIDEEKYAGIAGQVQVNVSLQKQIDINRADLETLRKNPYLSYKQANAIVQYRRQHGAYKSIDDLRQIVILNDEILRKIEPYLAFL